MQRRSLFAVCTCVWSALCTTAFAAPKQSGVVRAQATVSNSVSQLSASEHSLVYAEASSPKPIATDLLSTDFDAESAVSAAAAPAGMCVAPDVSERVAECPAHFTHSTSSVDALKPMRSGGGVVSKLHEAKRKVEQRTRKNGPSVQLDLATLRNQDQGQKKAKDLLLREIQVTKRLVKNTRTTDPRRPDYLLRLAEDQFELSHAAQADVRAYDEPIYQACSSGSARSDKQECSVLQNQQAAAERVLSESREENIRTLAMLVKDHPDYKRRDEVLFTLGFSLDEMQQFDRARQVYRRLIDEHPQSEYIPHAYLSFAEYHFQQGDMRAAQQFYRKVLEIPPARNRVYGYALYKQAWCTYNNEDYKSALRGFMDTIEFGTKHPDAVNVDNLVKQSRRELVLPYARVGTPDKAFDFFKKLAKDEAQAFEMLESLADLYFDTGKWSDAALVYHRLMAARPADDKLCRWQLRVASAVIASKPKTDQVAELTRTIDVYQKFEKAAHSGESKQQCRQQTATVLVDSATGWHREAIGTQAQPGTGDRGTMAQSVKLYTLLIENFPDMDSMQFPDIDLRDWPTQYKVAYYYAELLWKMENWQECGPAFDAVLSIDPQGEYTSDAAYAAVLCYNKHYQQSYSAHDTAARVGGAAGKDRAGNAAREASADKSAQYQPKELSSTEQGMLTAFQRYMCFVPDSDDLVLVKYRRARIYYESNHFEEAAVLFKDVAVNHKEHELGVYAANLYLDSLNALASYAESKRPACYDEMNASIEPLNEAYCDTPDAHAQNAELCNVLDQLRCDLLRKQAETLQAEKEYRQAANVYVSVFRKHRECGKLDEVLYNASINFEAARLIGRAIKVRKVLIERYPQSEWAKRALYLVGANYHALAMYDTAADYYEQFATRYPGEDGKDCQAADRSAGTCAVAYEALQNASFFRLGLGDEVKAVEDANLFERNYAHKFPRQTSQVKFAVGSIYEREKDWRKVVEHYTSYIGQYRRTALPNELIQADVNVGRAYLALAEKQGREEAKATRARALPFFKSAVKLWNDGAQEAIQRSDLPDDQRARDIGAAKIAAAEAYFNLADEDFEKFAGIAFPEFQSSVRGGDPDARRQRVQQQFQAWMSKDFGKWMDNKAKALDVAQKSYEKITQLSVPQWEIAAAARVGDMYLSFVNDFRDAPVPPSLQGDTELVDIYYQGLDDASKPWVEKAKGAYEYCLITATKVRWFNQYMTRCEEELFKLDPRQYPRASELRGSDNYAYSAPAVPGPLDASSVSPVRVGGNAEPEGNK